MPHEGKKHRGHPALWATLTLAVFPLVTMSLSAMGVGPFRSFLGGAAATLLVLLLEAAARGRWWMADPGIAHIMNDPAFGTRLLIVTGTVVLLFQSFVLVGLLTSGGYDGNVARFILMRQCTAGSQDPLFGRLCRAVSADHRIDATAMAIREAAEKRFFPGGIVTCAVRPLATRFTDDACTQAARVHCDRWIVGKVAREPVSAESVDRVVVAALRLMPDGSYRVDGWSDDPASAGWNAIGGDVSAEASASPRLNSDDPTMRAETYRRAVERLQAK
jgi:hypothetical protein